MLPAGSAIPIFTIASDEFSGKNSQDLTVCEILWSVFMAWFSTKEPDHLVSSLITEKSFKFKPLAILYLGELSMTDNSSVRHSGFSPGFTDCCDSSPWVKCVAIV